MRTDGASWSGMAAIGTLVEQPENRAALVEIELSVGSRHKEGSIVQAAAKPTESHFALETTRLQTLLQPS
jgi:hypothetical protein